MSLLKLSKKYKIEEQAVKKFDSWIESINTKDNISLLPEHFCESNVDVDYDTSRLLMYLSVNLGTLRTNYEIHCPNCNKKLDVAQRQLDIPSQLTCECNLKFEPLKHSNKIIVSFSKK